MKSLLFLLPVLIIGLVSCSSSKTEEVVLPCDASSCSTVPNSNPSPSNTAEVPAPTEQVFADENWSLSVPLSFDKLPSPISDPEVKVCVGKDKKILVIFLKEAFNGTSAEYVLSALRGIKDGGSKVNAAHQVDLNGNKFVVIDFMHDSIRTLMWTTAKNGFGYALYCGVQDNINQEDLCTKIANSLTIQ